MPCVASGFARAPLRWKDCDVPHPIIEELKNRRVVSPATRLPRFLSRPECIKRLDRLRPPMPIFDRVRSDPEEGAPASEGPFTIDSPPGCTETARAPYNVGSNKGMATMSLRVLRYAVGLLLIMSVAACGKIKVLPEPAGTGGEDVGTTGGDGGGTAGDTTGSVAGEDTGEQTTGDPTPPPPSSHSGIVPAAVKAKSANYTMIGTIAPGAANAKGAKVSGPAGLVGAAGTNGEKAE